MSRRGGGSEDRKRGGDFRIRFLGYLVVALFVAYSGYLFYLQAIRGSEYRSKARTIAVQTTKIPAQRGMIYDRTMTKPLAINSDSFAVDVVPAEVPSDVREEVFARLALTLGIKAEEIAKKVPPSYYHLYQAIQVATSVDYTTMASIAERQNDFPGVYWRSNPVRTYLDAGSLSHILGYVGEITRDEYKVMYNKGYASDDVIGKAGVEKIYDSILKGKDGLQYKTVDVTGKNVPSGQDQVDAPVQGRNLVLTIDAEIQKAAEKALGNRMGSVIVMKPTTGEILAMVSYPWYDSNIFSGNDSGNEYAKLLADPNTPLMNRAIQSSYPPASTFKTVLTTGIIEEKVFPEDKTVFCPGEITYGDRLFRCWVRKPGHGSVNLEKALAQSCDIYYWLVGRDYLGVEGIVDYAREYGFGKATGIDLPSEVEGFVPTPQWKERRYNEKWSGGDSMNLSIGQGFMLATPLQLADMMAMIVNDGVVYKPHVVKEVRDPATGAVVTRYEPEPILRSRISKETFAKVREDLRGVITVGSAQVPVNTKAVKVAGKTGTAEIGLKDRWHSWFVSYGPYDAPPEDAVVVVTMIEASNPWEWWGPYAANVIYQSIFTGEDAETAAKKVGVRLDQPQLRGKVE
ncbi:MAG: penicillin-binding protein 2 [Rectinema sp.]